MLAQMRKLAVGAVAATLFCGSALAQQTVYPAPFPFNPVAGAQYNLGVASPTALTVPAGATYATVCVVAQAVNYVTDLTQTVSATVGEPVAAGNCGSLSGYNVLIAARFFQQAATATINVEYFK